MAGLPNVNQLVTQIHEKVAEAESAELEKNAGEETEVSYTIEAAKNLKKLAGQLRKEANASLTYDDVRDFMKEVRGKNGR